MVVVGYKQQTKDNKQNAAFCSRFCRFHRHYSTRTMTFKIMITTIVLLFSLISVVNCCVENKVSATEVENCELKCENGTDICSKVCRINVEYLQLCCKGYARNTTIEDKPCEDIDECKITPPQCGENTDCVNTAGSFECPCKPGFLRAAYGNHCLDIDECLKKPCHENAFCVNTPGSYRCECTSGFKMSGDGLKCEDVDECAFSLTALCTDANTECRNSVGSYECICQNGFEKVSPEIGNYCKDIDECLLSNGTICVNADCRNSVGSFQCTCHPGFDKDETGRVCVDRDECQTNEARCPRNTSCVNTNGTYVCMAPCPTGLRQHPDHGCIDVNECQFQNNCSHYCHNEHGSYSCSCPFFFYLSHDGHTCNYGYLDDEVVVFILVGLALLAIIVIISSVICARKVFAARRTKRRHGQLIVDHRMHDPKQSLYLIDKPRRDHRQSDESASPQTTYYSSSSNSSTLQKDSSDGGSSSARNNNKNNNKRRNYTSLQRDSADSTYRQHHRHQRPPHLVMTSSFPALKPVKTPKSPLSDVDHARRPILLPRYNSLDEESPVPYLGSDVDDESV